MFIIGLQVRSVRVAPPRTGFSQGRGLVDVPNGPNPTQNAEAVRRRASVLADRGAALAPARRGVWALARSMGDAPTRIPIAYDAYYAYASCVRWRAKDARWSRPANVRRQNKNTRRASTRCGHAPNHFNHGRLRLRFSGPCWSTRRSVGRNWPSVKLRSLAGSDAETVASSPPKLRLAVRAAS